MTDKTKSIATDWKSVSICSVDHNIVLKPSREMPDQLGLCLSDTQQIWLCETNSDETMLNVLLHESIHTIDHVYNLDMTERQVAVLATALISFARDNPKIAAQIFAPKKN